MNNEHLILAEQRQRQNELWGIMGDYGDYGDTILNYSWYVLGADFFFSLFFLSSPLEQAEE